LDQSKEQSWERVLLYLVLGMGILAVSSAAVLIRLADEAPASVIAAYRMGIASVVLAPLAGLKYHSHPSRPTLKQIGLMAVSGGFLALHLGLWIASLQFTSVASSVFLVTSRPIFVVVGSWVFLRERALPQEVLGIAVGVTGGVIITAGDLSLSGEELKGNLLAVAGAVSVAGYLLIGRSVRGHTTALTYVGVVYPIAAVLLFATAIGSGATFTGFAASTYLWLALVALAPQVVGHTSLNWSLGHIRATGVAIAVMAEPVGASLLAWFVLQETPSVWTIVGGFLILAGVFLALRRRG